MSAGWQDRIDQDMARVPAMPLHEAVGFLNGYSHRVFGAEISSGELLLEQVRAYADKSLERAWAAFMEVKAGK